MYVGIVGLGLIGGSVARAIKANTSYEVLGADLSMPIVLRAKLMEVIDDEMTVGRVGICDVIIMALYPRDTVSWLQEHADIIKKGAVVVDCSGVKMAVCEPCWRIAEEKGFTFIGGHPMDGIAKIGFDNSKEDMFKNASMILVPHKDIDIETMKKFKDVFDAIGFTHYEISTPEKHDRIIALTSQLAHVVSSAYVQSPTAMEHQGYSAGSFKDMTRVAYLNEKMWAQLFMLNRENLRNEITQLIERLGVFSDALRRGDEERLVELLREGRAAKVKLDKKNGEGE